MTKKRSVSIAAILFLIYTANQFITQLVSIVKSALVSNSIFYQLFIPSVINMLPTFLLLIATILLFVKRDSPVVAIPFAILFVINLFSLILWLFSLKGMFYLTDMQKTYSVISCTVEVFKWLITFVFCFILTSKKNKANPNKMKTIWIVPVALIVIAQIISSVFYIIAYSFTIVSILYALYFCAMMGVLFFELSRPSNPVPQLDALYGNPYQPAGAYAPQTPVQPYAPQTPVQPYAPQAPVQPQSTAPVGNSSNGLNTLEERLAAVERFKKLYEEGIITQDEYLRKKAELLNH